MRRHPDRSGDGDRLGQRRLAGAGHVLEQQVTLGEQAHQRRGDLVALALDDELDVLQDAVEVVAEPFGVLVGDGDGHGVPYQVMVFDLTPPKITHTCSPGKP